MSAGKGANNTASSRGKELAHCPFRRGAGPRRGHAQQTDEVAAAHVQSPSRCSRCFALLPVSVSTVVVQQATGHYRFTFSPFHPVTLSVLVVAPCLLFSVSPCLLLCLPVYRCRSRGHWPQSFHLVTFSPGRLVSSCRCSLSPLLRVSMSAVMPPCLPLSFNRPLATIVSPCHLFTRSPCQFLSLLLVSSSPCLHVCCYHWPLTTSHSSFHLVTLSPSHLVSRNPCLPVCRNV